MGMRGARFVIVLLTLVLCAGACGPFAGPDQGPGGVHEGDRFAAKLEDGRVIDGFVSGWAGENWVGVHRTGDLVQRVDLTRVATFKVRCSHD